MGERSRFGQWPYRQVHDGIRRYEQWKSTRQRRKRWVILGLIAVVVGMILWGLLGS